MTKAETAKVLAVLRAAYPHSFKDMTATDTNAALNLWSRIFADEDPNLVSAAVDSLISTRTVGYSPTPGEVKAEIHKLLHVQELDDQSAWAMVSKACQNGLYGYREEFERLPEAVQKAVGAPEQLKQWAMMDSETVESVVASNFMRSYRTIQKREKDLAMIPGSVRSVLAEISDSMKMDEKSLLPEPKKEKYLPLPLEPLTKPEYRQQFPQTEPQYKVPDADTWEKQREKVLQMLEGEKP